MRWKNEWSYLAQVPRALTTFRGILKVSSAGTLDGLQVPSGSAQPRTEAVRARRPVDRRHRDADASTTTPTGRVGGDVKYGITQNITADLTVNTDFAQVEVDEQQVNLTRFNLFFPEKRDFFLEGLGTFAFAGRASAGLGAGTGDTPYLFFSRRIGLDQSRVIPILAGGRTTGKAGKFTFGALNVQTGDDETPRRSTPRTSPCCAPSATSCAAAASAACSRIAPRRRAGPAANDGYGVDAALSFYQNVRIDAYLAATQTEGRDGDDLSYRGFFDYNGDKYGVQAERLVVEPNFLPEIGFVRRTDMRRNFGLLRYSPRPKGVPHLRKLTTQASLNYLTNNQNRLDTREGSGRVREPNSPTATSFSVSYTDSFERLVRPFAIATGVTLPVGGYDFHTTRIGYIGGQQRRVSGEVVYETGTFYNGDRQSIALNTARVQVTPQVSLEPSFSINWVDLVQGSFTAKVARTRATYTITPRMFVSGIVQYNTAGTSFGSNVRFRWEYRPGSELFVVYTDDYNTEEPRPDVTSLRNRALVIKFNRLFRL